MQQCSCWTFLSRFWTLPMPLDTCRSICSSLVRSVGIIRKNHNKKKHIEFWDLRFILYKAHVTCTVFCSMCEIALSIERRIAIMRPRAYHFSEMKWKAMAPLTLVLVSFGGARFVMKPVTQIFLAYAVDYCVHNGSYVLHILENDIFLANSRLEFVGFMLLNVIEISVVVVRLFTFSMKSSLQYLFFRPAH